ncbi:hypothetical protein AB1Y20_009423 [Prymnesium parvum]|uniref:Ubiquitinyl hydrolase 1 n=1 Tax=Prymnesium parvum TaxID=97485 RepID=A0AB34K4F2_PRYPA
MREATGEASAAEGLRCARHLNCTACTAHGCAFCAAARDVRSCVSVGRARFFCHTMAHTKLSLPGAHACTPSARDGRGCPPVEQLRPCSTDPSARAPSCTKGCCAVHAVEWLLRHFAGGEWSVEGFERADVVLKAELAAAWRRGDNEAGALVEGYLQFLRRRGGSELESRNDFSASRLELFRGLYASVREAGFQWEMRPLEVDAAFRLVDGSHRLALALAFNESRVVLSQTCAPPRVTSPMNLAYLRGVSPTLASRAAGAVQALAQRPNQTARARHPPPLSALHVGEERRLIVPADVDASLGTEPNWARILSLIGPPRGGEDAWRAYAARLYSAAPNDTLPTREEVDMVYVDGGALLREIIVPPRCPPAEPSRPYLGRAPHAPRQAVWLSRAPPFVAVANDSWVEITHCGGGWNERSGYWAYVARGSGIFLHTGRTIAFAGHEEAVRHFFGTGCRDETAICNAAGHCSRECDEELPLLVEEARRLRFDNLQFISHCDLRCGLCAHELVLTAASGDEACSPHLEYRRGLRASLPCECVASRAVATLRGKCASCARTTPSRRRAPPPPPRCDDMGADDTCAVGVRTEWGEACAAAPPVAAPPLPLPPADGLGHLAARLQATLVRRGVLCDAGAPCNVTHVGSRGRRLLRVCAPPARRVFCAPFAAERSSDPRARCLAYGCALEAAPCQLVDPRAVDADVRELLRTHRQRSAFYGAADAPPSRVRAQEEEVYARLQRRPRSRGDLRTMLAPMRTERGRRHQRCALVGANHRMRCGEWGAALDSEYDAIFRANGFQLDRHRVPNQALVSANPPLLLHPPHTPTSPSPTPLLAPLEVIACSHRAEQWMHPRHAGTKTTYRQSCLTGGKRLNSTRSEVCILGLDFFTTQATHTDHTQVCGRPALRSEYTERSVAAATREGFQFLLFGRGKPGQSLLGDGSGDAASLAALVLCNHTDVYGVGLHSKRMNGNAFEIVYQHGYDDALGGCHPRAHQSRCDDMQTLVVLNHLTREIRWALLHVLGVFNWIF